MEKDLEKIYNVVNNEVIDNIMKKAIDPQIINVVAYCRVSTDKEDQANSLESQQRYFTDYINRNPQWNLLQLYVDEGITGTSTKKRTAFNQMIADAELGLFDLILTKEISRFARNTLDSIFYTRKLKEKGIGVIFLNDNINTLDPDAELRLTIMASIAQEESRKTSDRVKWGQKRRMEAGVVFGRNILGYDLKNGVLTVNEEEAKIIRLIFKKYLDEEKGATTIAKELENAGIKTKNGKDTWTFTSIYKILKNEKYAGDLIQKKTYTPNYLTHDKKYNHGQEEFVHIKNHHEPIIDIETFNKVQDEIKRRSTMTEEQKHRHTNRYTFSGKIVCGMCGSVFVGRQRKQKKENPAKRYWQCGNKTKYGTVHTLESGKEVGCNMLAISDVVMQDLTHKVVSDIIKDKSLIKKNILTLLQNVLNGSNITEDEVAVKRMETDINKIGEKKRQLIDLYMENGITKSDLKTMNQHYDYQLLTLQKRKVEALQRHRQYKSKEEIIKAASRHIEKVLEFKESNDEVYRNMVDKIVMHDRSHYDFYIKGVLGESTLFELKDEDKKNKPKPLSVDASTITGQVATNNLLYQYPSAILSIPHMASNSAVTDNAMTHQAHRPLCGFYCASACKGKWNRIESLDFKKKNFTVSMVFCIKKCCKCFYFCCRKQAIFL